MTPLRLAVTAALVVNSAATNLQPLRTREQGLCLATSARQIAERTLCPTNNGLHNYAGTKPLKDRTPADHHTGPANLNEAAKKVLELRQGTIK
jgi:hypothetical protein